MTSQNYHQLSLQFLEMWQRQAATTMNDPAFIQSMLDVLKTYSPVGATEASGAANASTSHTSVSFEHVVERMDAIEYRLRMLDARLQQLESAAKLHPTSAKPKQRNTRTDA